MRLIATVLLLLLPGALATFLHLQLKRQGSGLYTAAVFAAYTAIIDGALCGFKLVRGAALDSFWNWFSPPLSFTFYIFLAGFAAVLLPLLYVLVTERRFALRLRRDAQLPDPEKPGKRHVGRALLRMLAVLLAGILLGGVLVTAVYILPTKPIEQNVRLSAQTVREEGSYPFLYANWRSTRLDNFTDSIMLLMAAYPGDEGTVQNAMLSTYTRFAGHNPAEGLVKWSTSAVDGMETHSYSRYWHGYLVWLKPLLEFFTYAQIRIINTILQILLTLTALGAMLKTGRKRLVLPFLVMVLFLTPTALFQSFQFSWIFYVFMIASVILLLRFNALQTHRSVYLLFLITGMATSYVDFLTYPLITLGVPLALYFALRGRRRLTHAALDGAALSLSWGIGYIGMWAGKWVLCALLTDSDVLRSVQDNILSRMSFAYVEEVFSWVDVIKRNIEAYNHWIYLGPFLLCLLLYILLFAREHINLDNRRLTINASWLAGLVVPLAVTALLPLAWFFVASNHTYIHYWYAHRTLAVSALAILLWFARPAKH